MQVYQVAAGVDTLKVSAVGLLKSDVRDLLHVLQAEAIAQRDQRRHKGDVLVDTHWTLDGEAIMMTPHGGGHGRWSEIMKCPSATFELGPGHMNGISCQVRLSSAFLWRHGYRQAWALVEAFLAPLCESGTWFQVSEVHPCADIAGVAIATLKDAHFVTRAQVVRWHQDDALILELAERQSRHTERPTLELIKRYRDKETLTFSPRGNLSVQVYNKPREIRRKSPDKAWFGDIWERNGWDRAAPVARIEARYRREILHELGCETVAQTFDQLDATWRYVTGHWLRHTVPNHKDSYQWPLSTFWKVVQAVTFERIDAAPAQRDTVHHFRETQMLSAIMGYLESWAAWQGSDGVVPDELSLAGILDQIHDRATAHYQHKGSAFRQEVVRKRKVFGISAGERAPSPSDVDDALYAAHAASTFGDRLGDVLRPDISGVDEGELAPRLVDHEETFIAGYLALRKRDFGF